MVHHCAVADAHLADLAECRLKSGQKLRLQLGINSVSGIIGLHVAADLLIEQNRVHKTVRILTEAADRDIHVNACSLIHNAEGNRIGGAVLVADDLLRIEEVHSLILAGVAAHGETLLEGLKALLDAFAETTVEDTRLGGSVIHKFACLCADLCDGALVHDDHALTLVNRDDGTIRDDVVTALGVCTSRLLSLCALADKYILRKRRTIEILTPLIGKYAAECANASL